MGLVCEVTFETSFSGTFSIRYEAGPEGSELGLAEFGKTRHRVLLVPSRAERLGRTLLDLRALPLSQPGSAGMLDGTCVSGLLIAEEHQEAWAVDDLCPERSPHEYKMAWLLAEAAWELFDAAAQSILLLVRAEVGRELPRIAVLEREVGDVWLARVLWPFSEEQRLSIEQWATTMPVSRTLVMDLSGWFGARQDEWVTQLPLTWLLALASRPRTAFIWPSTTLPAPLHEIVGSHHAPDFDGARRHALFGR